jgi:hypothetical protein
MKALPMSGQKFQLYWVGAQHQGSAEIGFPLFEYRPQIKEENVVLTGR